MFNRFVQIVDSLQFSLECWHHNFKHVEKLLFPEEDSNKEKNSEKNCTSKIECKSGKNLWFFSVWWKKIIKSIEKKPLESGCEIAYIFLIQLFVFPHRPTIYLVKCDSSFHNNSWKRLLKMIFMNISKKYIFCKIFSPSSRIFEFQLTLSPPST